MAGQDLTKGPILKTLARISAPISFGIFAGLSVGMADAWFLGPLGATPLAAIGFIFPATAAFTSLAIGLSAGANATNPAGMAFVTAAVATVGDAAVVGFGVATRVQSVALVPRRTSKIRPSGKS